MEKCHIVRPFSQQKQPKSMSNYCLTKGQNHFKGVFCARTKSKLGTITPWRNGLISPKHKKTARFRKETRLEIAQKSGVRHI